MAFFNNSCSRRQFLACLGLGALSMWASPAVAAATGPDLPADFTPLNLHAGGFSLRAWLRPGQGQLLHVFIEGDGQIWDASQRSSFDPTPRHSVAARLAADAPRPDPVLYLARPGQYASPEELRRLSPQWWTSHRYARPVVEAIAKAALEGRRRSSAAKLGLYGHSGGGALAVLAAAGMLEEVSLLASVASPLDTQAWASSFAGQSLPHSLNPKDVARQVREVPQFHLSGGRDNTAPTAVLDAWLQELEPLPPWIQRIVVPAADHQGPWLQPFRQALAGVRAGVNGWG